MRTHTRKKERIEKHNRNNSLSTLELGECWRRITKKHPSSSKIEKSSTPTEELQKQNVYDFHGMCIKCPSCELPLRIKYKLQRREPLSEVQSRMPWKMPVLHRKNQPCPLQNSQLQSETVSAHVDSHGHQYLSSHWTRSPASKRGTKQKCEYSSAKWLSWLGAAAAISQAASPQALSSDNRAWMLWKRISKITPHVLLEDTKGDSASSCHSPTVSAPDGKTPETQQKKIKEEAPVW